MIEIEIEEERKERVEIKGPEKEFVKKGKRPKKHNKEEVNKSIENQKHKVERYTGRRDRSNQRKEYHANRTGRWW